MTQEMTAEQLKAATKQTAVGYKLPLPPSVNNLFATVRGRRVKSLRYRHWLADAGLCILQQGKCGIASPVKVSIYLDGKVNRQRDLDNFSKPVLDLLTSAGVIQNDNLMHVVAVHMVYSPSAKPACLSVWVHQVDI